MDVAEADLPALEPGQKLRVHANAFPEKVFAGTVEKIGDTLDPATRTVKVRGGVANPDKLLKAEMYVTVDVEEASGQAGGRRRGNPGLVRLHGGQPVLSVRRNRGRRFSNASR